MCSFWLIRQTTFEKYFSYVFQTFFLLISLYYRKLVVKPFVEHVVLAFARELHVEEAERLLRGGVVKS